MPNDARSVETELDGYKKLIESKVDPELSGLLILLQRPTIHVELPAGRVGDAETRKAIPLSPSTLSFLYAAYQEALPSIVERARVLAKESILRHAHAIEEATLARAKALEADLAAIRAVLDQAASPQR